MFKKLKLPLLLVATFLASVIVNSHYRPLQTQIHKGINWIYDQNESVGEFLFDANAFVFNGRHFDYERSVKNTIYENFAKVVMIQVSPNEDNIANPLMRRMAGQGTGFFVEVTDEYALIMTNHHVIDSHTKNPETTVLTVRTPMEMWDYDATVVGTDPIADIAIIKVIKKDNEEWEAMEFAHRDDISVGDPLVVIGHGMSMAWNNTSGIVTYNGRYGARPYALMLQTDAVINPGNSGGPVIGFDDKVLGVAQSILSPGRGAPAWDGVGLAVSARQAKRSMDYILSDAYKEKGYVPYVEFPVNINTFDFDAIKDVEKDKRNYVYVDYTNLKEEDRSVGFAAGLQQGDVIKKLNGEDLMTSYRILVDTIHAFPGDVFTFEVLRNGETITIEVELIETDYDTLLGQVMRRGR